MRPAWGPPRSLSPEKHTTSAPASSSSEAGQLTDRRVSGEADDPEVRLVGDEDGGRVVSDGTGKVDEMGTVGAADLGEYRTRGRHHVGETKRTADLDQLAPRYDDLAAGRVRPEDEEQGSGVVVDHDGAWRAGLR